MPFEASGRVILPLILQGLASSKPTLRRFRMYTLGATLTFRQAANHLFTLG